MYVIYAMIEYDGGQYDSHDEIDIRYVAYDQASADAFIARQPPIPNETWGWKRVAVVHVEAA